MKQAKYSRAESLLKIRNLVVIGIERGIIDRAQLVRDAISEGVLTRSFDKQEYSEKSSYRYLYGLRSLKFDIADDANAAITWSPAAFDLANVGSTIRSSDELSEVERAIFRNQIFFSEASELFLRFFRSDLKTPHSAQDLKEGVPLYVLGTTKRLSAVSGKEIAEVEIAQLPNAGLAWRKLAMEFLYTYRLWCLDAQLIEEIKIKEAERSGIPKQYSHVLYPIRQDSVPSVPQFLDALYSAVGGSNRAEVIPIPKLLYTMCVDLRMKVESFKSLLVETWRQHRSLLHLERGPGVLIEGDLSLPESMRPHRERFGNYRYYIMIDGTIRSNLVLFPRI